MERENNPIKLPLETWCSLTVLTKETETLDACITSSQFPTYRLGREQMLKSPETDLS